jgi:hypothetical protein
MRNQELPLTADELRSLRCLAGMMIPANTAHGVPGADDDTIFADVVHSLGRDAASVKQGCSTWMPWLVAASPTVTRSNVKRPRRRCRTPVARR